MLIDMFYVIEGNDLLKQNSEIENKVRNFIAKPIIFINPEGGKGCWASCEYQLAVKIMFLIKLNQNIDYKFISDAPISVDFFDQWWTIKKCYGSIEKQDVLDNVNISISQRIKLTGNETVDKFIGEINNFSGNRALELNLKDYPKYRIYKDTNVIGWLTDVKWDWDEVKGDLQITINKAGDAYKKDIIGKDNITSDVVIEGTHYTPAIMTHIGDRVILKIQRENTK